MIKDYLSIRVGDRLRVGWISAGAKESDMMISDGKLVRSLVVGDVVTVMDVGEYRSRNVVLYHFPSGLFCGSPFYRSLTMDSGARKHDVCFLLLEEIGVEREVVAPKGVVVGGDVVKEGDWIKITKSDLIPAGMEVPQFYDGRLRPLGVGDRVKVVGVGGRQPGFEFPEFVVYQLPIPEGYRVGLEIIIGGTNFGQASYFYPKYYGFEIERDVRVGSCICSKRTIMMTGCVCGHIRRWGS